MRRRRMCPSCRARFAPEPEPLLPAEATSAQTWACTCDLVEYDDGEQWRW